MKKIAANRNYRLVKKAFRDPTLMSATKALQDAGWSQWFRGDGIYFTKGQEGDNSFYEIKVEIIQTPEK